MMRLLVIALSLVWASTVGAAEFWVAKTGSDTNCSTIQSSSNPALTITFALGCESAGDTIWVGDGVYAEAGLGALIAAGTSESNRTTLRSVTFRGAIIRPTTSLQAMLLTGKPYVSLIDLVVDGVNAGNTSIKLESNSHHFIGDGIELRGTNTHLGQGLLCQSSPQGILRRSYIHGHGNPTTQLDHGIYLNTGCDDWLIERNDITDNTTFATQLYAAPNRTTYQYNYLHANCQMTQSGGAELVAYGTGHKVRYNMIVVSGNPSCTSGFPIRSSTSLHAYGNTVVCTGSCSYGIASRSAALNPVVENNLIIGSFDDYILDESSSTTPLPLLDFNLSGSTLSAHFTDSGNGDFTLKSTSTAIDGAADMGDAFCGTGKDYGAFEVPKITAASISGNVLLVTICSAHPPIIPGTFTVARSGGSPTVLSTSLQGGSGGIVRLEVSETCAAAQTWTVSGGTSTTDSALIGNQFNQPLHTTTDFAVDSSACDGTSGPSAPAGEVAHYEFENDLTDSSGNGNTGTGSNISYTTGRSGQGVLTQANVDSHIDTGLLSGHDPSTTHLVVSVWSYIDPADLSQTKDIWGVPTGTNQRFLLYRHSGDTWRMSIGATSGTASEFPVVSGWTHICVKANATTDTATMYINGEAGTTSGASVISYSSYTFAGDLRFGLPSGFGTSLSGAQILEDAYIYTTDVSCTDLYNAGQPSTGSAMAVQATHQWQGVFTASGGTAEDRGAADAQRTVVKGGAAALMVQLDCTGGDCGAVQPRFRYNINGGSFTNVVPDSPTADGASHWGASIPSGLNNGFADGPISGALSHTDGITLTTSSAIPTITMGDDTSYTLRGIFIIDASIGDVVCFKVYDQSGSALASYTPAAGACLTVIAPQATGGY